jgi:hypothetical protein
MPAVPASSGNRNIPAPKEKKPKCSREEFSEAERLCQEIIDNLSEMPDKAYEYAELIGEKARSVQAGMEKYGNVTMPQLEMLRNMRSGQENWINGDN